MQLKNHESQYYYQKKYNIGLFYELRKAHYVEIQKLILEEAIIRTKSYLSGKW